MVFKRRGSQYERDLLKRFWEAGIGGVRVAGSGSTSLPAIDLIVGKDGKIIGIEVKSTSKDKIYLNEMQIEEIKELSKAMGIKVYFAFKFKHKEWLFLPLEKIPKNRKIDLGFLEKEGIKLKDLISKEF